MNWFKEIFVDYSGEVSSKRVFGGIGFLVSLVLCFTGVSIEILATVLGTSATMLGLDSVVDIWRKK